MRDRLLKNLEMEKRELQEKFQRHWNTLIQNGACLN